MDIIGLFIISNTLKYILERLVAEKMVNCEKYTLHFEKSGENHAPPISKLNHHVTMKSSLI